MRRYTCAQRPSTFGALLRPLVLLAALIAAALALPGCARTPSGAHGTSIRRAEFTIAFAGAINDDYYYFVPIDTSGGGEGPVPVYPGSVAGQAWVTGSANYYVQYHQRQYMVYEITSLLPFESQPIGVPLKYTLPSTGGQTLEFTIDLDTINATEDTIDFNIIAVSEPYSTERLIDGLGPTGNDFVNLDITYGRTITNEDDEIEGSGDVLNQNAQVQFPSSTTNPLDIVDWAVTTTIDN